MLKIVTALMLLFSVQSMLIESTEALEADRDLPATIEADEVEYDFRTGERTYKGNVVVEQGSLRITGDKLVVNYKDEKLESATAWGRPASFKQRPDGKDQDVVGKGNMIILDQIVNTLTLQQNASLQQGEDVARGDEIVYDITNDKLAIRGSAATQKKAEAGESGTEESKPTRAKVVITPQ